MSLLSLTASMYLLVYSFMAFGYLWYRYVPILIEDKKTKGNYKGKVSVIIPFYNEEPELLYKTIRSALLCKGDNEIIVVDDGSTDKYCYNMVREMQISMPIKIFRYEKNKGKRYAQCVGFKKATGDIIMTLDSDTILQEFAIVHLIKPFSKKSVGATTGQLEALNEKKNFLTRLISARYWNAFNFERKSQGALGVLICCSGPISAYRKQVIDEIMPEYQNQEFMGKKCTYGDDRHLTTLMLKYNKEIVYVKEAKGYTEVPDNYKQFIKQQIRWKKSWLRENYLVSKFMFKKGFNLPFEIILTTFITFFSLPARILLIIALILNPMYIFTAIFIITLMAGLHSLYALFYKPKHFIYSVMYGFIHAFIVYWLVYIAIFRFKDTGWGTR